MTSSRTGVCLCGRPVADHFDPDNAFIGCPALALRPMTVTLPDGQVLTARTPRDAYRIAALARKVA